MFFAYKKIDEWLIFFDERINLFDEIIIFVSVYCIIIH